MYKILDKINSPEELKKLDPAQLQELCNEIRQFLIDNVSKTGGHLASNLGVVELTVALHTTFRSPFDKIIWDVGHQSYVHKILTGRKDVFHTLKQFQGICGFPKRKESEHDVFGTGHSSTSISAAMGIAKARDLKNEKYHVIAVIGDGALTGGMAFEAMNDAGRSPNQLIVILNDNAMSITKNVGGISRYLNRIRTEPIYFKAKEDLNFILNKIPAIGKGAAKALDAAKGSIKYLIMPGVIFEELGFTYIGPIDGHNLGELRRVIGRAKNMSGPILIHVLTKKGKGYVHAEKNPDIFHGISPFDVESGEVAGSKGETYSDVFGNTLVEIAKEDSAVAAITAAMPDGTGLKAFAAKFPERFFDVGIAEQHAVTFAAGLASNDLKPVFAVYSSFLQRSYDQILHDVALQNLHVVFGIDRAGIVGEDGETHQGIYDLSYLSHIPNMTVIAPKDYEEFRNMIKYAVCTHKGPIAIRYPRGKGIEKLTVNSDRTTDNIPESSIQLGKGEILSHGKDITLIAAGSMVESAVHISHKLKEYGFECEIINGRFIKPLDEKLIVQSVMKTGKVAVMEDNTIMGGFGSAILELLNRAKINAGIKLFGFPDEFIQHGTKAQLLKKYRLDNESILSDILKMLGKES